MATAVAREAVRVVETGEQKRLWGAAASLSTNSKKKKETKPPGNSPS